MIWRWPSTMIAVVVNEDPFGTWLQTYLQRQEYIHQRGQLAFELLHGNFSESAYLWSCASERCHNDVEEG